MKNLNITIIMTKKCNLRCKYCINNSGSDFNENDGSSNEWQSSQEIIDCLKNISKARHISIIKFFGGEPTLTTNFIKDIINNKKEFSKDGDVKFAFTTNAYNLLDDDLLKIVVNNKVRINISLDGPEIIHNEYRIPVGKGNCFQNVIKNIKKLQDLNYDFSLDCVLDDRIVTHGLSIVELAHYLSQYTPVYTINPAYNINKALPSKDTINKILKYEEEYIDYVFNNIYSLSISDNIYENNLLRTIANIGYNTNKPYICSAGGSMSIYPSKKAYSCYNLQNKDFFICDDVSTINPDELNKIIDQKHDLLKIENFSQEYFDVLMYGDYCVRENDFLSLSYLYRKLMVNKVKNKIKDIKAGSPEHLALLSYIIKGYDFDFYKYLNGEG